MNMMTSSDEHEDSIMMNMKQSKHLALSRVIDVCRHSFDRDSAADELCECRDVVQRHDGFALKRLRDTKVRAVHTNLDARPPEVRKVARETREE